MSEKLIKILKEEIEMRRKKDYFWQYQNENSNDIRAMLERIVKRLEEDE